MSLDLSEMHAAINTRHVCDNSLTKDFESLLSSGDGSDVTLVVNGKEIRAHRLILSTRCEVFSRLFAHEKAREVEIHDTTPEALRCLIGYLYTDKCDINIENVVDVARLSHQYQVDYLYKCSINSFKHLLKPDNAIVLWVSAHNAALLELVDVAEKFVLRNFFQQRAKFENKEVLLAYPDLMMQVITRGKLVITCR